MIGVCIAPRTRKCRGQRLNAPGTSYLFLFYGVPYGLAALANHYNLCEQRRGGHYEPGRQNPSRYAHCYSS